MPKLSVRPSPPWHGLLVAGVFSMSAGSCAHANDLIVVTDSQHPVQAPAHARVIVLDQAARIEAELSGDLPSNASESASLVQRRLKDGGQALQRRIAKAYQDVVDAWSLGVSSIPAVVVEQRFVVYGETDVPEAVARIKAHREGQTQ